MLMGSDATSTDDSNSPAICIRAVSLYGQAGVLAESLEYTLKPTSHDPGGHHIISVRLIALLSRCDEQTIQEWAKTGEHFIQLDWTFPGCSYPKFTTRHALSKGQALGDVSFSGGLGWAQRMAKAASDLGLTKVPVQAHPEPYGWDPVRPEHTQRIPLQPPAFTNWFSRGSCPGFLTDPLPLFHSHGRGHDEVSGPTDGLSEETLSDAGTSLAFSEASDNMDSHLAGDPSFVHELADSLDQQQMQVQLLQRQRIDAEAMYALNGDTSGMFALLASASQFGGSWDDDGMPRF